MQNAIGIFTSRTSNKIHTMTRKYDIIWSEELDSTNEEARRRISDLDNLSVLSALSQTAGRGQRGNTWSSEAGRNLTFSIVLKFMSGTDTASDERAVHEALPPLKASDQFVISEIAALSVVELLGTIGLKSEIKWPNDIYVGPKKICGMLIENTLRGNHLSSSIIGIGLNVNQKDFDISLPNPTSMLLEVTKPEYFPALSEKSAINTCEPVADYDIEALLNGFMDIFVTLIDRYMSDRQDSFEELREDYLSHLWRLDETARFIDYTVLPSGHSDKPVVTGITEATGREFTGIIRGLSPVGNLLVEDLDAIALREFSFKEIGCIL